MRAIKSRREVMEWQEIFSCAHKDEVTGRPESSHQSHCQQKIILENGNWPSMQSRLASCNQLRQDIYRSWTNITRYQVNEMSCNLWGSFFKIFLCVNSIKLQCKLPVTSKCQTQMGLSCCFKEGLAVLEPAELPGLLWTTGTSGSNRDTLQAWWFVLPSFIPLCRSAVL